MSAHEHDKLLQRDPWSRKEARATASCICCTAAVVLGTYYWLPLLASLETDPTLHWTPSITTYATTSSAFSETVGHLLAGPLADYYPSSALLTVAAATMPWAIMTVYTLRDEHLLATVFIIVAFIKGLLWPTLTAIVAGNVGQSKHEFVFAMLATSSRLGVMIGSLILGVCLNGEQMSWRESVLVIFVAVTMLVIASFMLWPANMHEPEGSKAVSMSDLLEKWKRLLCCANGGLAFLALAGASCVFGLATYVAPILHDSFHQSPQAAAAETISMPLGSFMGLLFAALSASVFRKQVSRMMNVCQGMIAVTALTAIAVGVIKSTAILVILYSIVGFGFVIAAYTPYLCYSASSSLEDRGFRSAVLSSAGQLVQVGASYLYGHLRDQYGTTAVLGTIHGIAAAGLLTGVLAMALLFTRIEAR